MNLDSLEIGDKGSPPTHTIIPKEPPAALLASMAIRHDHAFGILPEAHRQVLLTEMRQLYEEVAGTGFYKWDGHRDEYYNALARGEAPTDPAPNPNAHGTGDDFDHDKAAAEMLLAGVLFTNGRRYLDHGKRVQPETTVLFVLCNDVFAWGCADAEDLPHSEIESLYRLFDANNDWGPIQWVCKRRNQQPQAPMKELMEKQNAWPEWMNALPPNKYDAFLAEENETKSGPPKA